MTNEQVNHDVLRAKLQELRDELLAVQETGEEAAETVELDQARVGRLSRMDAMQSQAMSLAAGQRRATALRQISLALARMDSGDYGFCTSCDEQIIAERLEANPAVSCCLACARELEA